MRSAIKDGYSSLEELRADRRAYVEIARRNRFEQGLRTLLADLYPDNAHFIYELLQNAEDARATTIEFDLGRSRLVVSHDGQRSFNLTDIDAITGIGQSSKKDDATQIGKFGVGFKAVFAYTNRPEIRSDEYSFAIQDLFVPEMLTSGSPGGKTVFTFPFDRKEKPRAVAYDEIARGLRELTETTVLFLSSIGTIKYKCADGSNGRISRLEGTYPYMSIKNSSDGETEESHWLRLVGDHSLSDQIPVGQTIAAAFRLDGPPNNRIRAKGTARAHVVPVTRGETCIYFPAVKESSGLKFHIHAPFASTVARDSVRQSPDNTELVDAIGRLIATVLPQLKDDGLMDDGLLASLPNAADPLEAPYTAIRDRIREAFCEEEITPVFGGNGFAAATSLVSSPAVFRAGIDAKDLPTLVALAGIEVDGTAQWVAPREGRAGRLLSGLGVVPLGWTELSRVLTAIRGESEERKTWGRWLLTKSDEQLKAFYELLGSGVSDGSLASWSLSKVDLIRVRTKSRRLHLAGSEVFMPVSRTDSMSGNRVPIDLAYFEGDKASKSKAHLEAFYEAAGVRRWNERSQVQVRLAAYSDKRFPSDEQHLEDMRVFVDHLSGSPEDRGLFTRVQFLKVNLENGKQGWGNPSAAYLDSPYRRTGLSALHAGAKTPCGLSSLYARKVNGVEAFADAVGCVSSLSISEAAIWGNREVKPEWYAHGRQSEYAKTVDWDLPELDAILATKSRPLLKLLWDLLSSLPASRADAVFQLNASARAYPVRSQLFQRLDGKAWILDRRGRLKHPHAMTADDLSDGWTQHGEGTLVSRLGFGENARVRDAAETELRKGAKALGMPSEMFDEFMKFSPEDREEFFADAVRKVRQRQSFPSAGSLNPERRARLVSIDAESAPIFETETRERRVVQGSTETRERGRQYLCEQYTRPDGAMHCQACQLELPFKVGGRWYFQAVQFLPERKKMHHQNVLSLCPLCAAKYTYVRDTDDDALLASLLELEIDPEDDQVSLAISVDAQRIEVMFTARHAIDLKAALSTAGEGRG